MRPSQQTGFTLPAAAIIAIVMTLLIIEIVKIVNVSSHEMVYFNAMNRSYRLAETALNQAMGQLSIDPLYFFDGSWVSVSTENGHYQNLVTPITTPIEGGFYIVSSATRTVGGKQYSCRLHSYVAVSNVGDYFAATSTKLLISKGMQAPNGKVYSPVLEFLVPTGAPFTNLLSANFVTQCIPPLNWSLATQSAITIAEPLGVNQPVQLASRLIFPQVLNSDIDRYKNLAGIHTSTGTFWGDIYPPGFAEYDDQLPADWQTAHPFDHYWASHTATNAEHVYFYDGDMRIEGTIHGQILFVATGDIYISSSIINFAGTNFNDFPGYTDQTASSSTAHQAVLITRKKIIVDNSFYKGPIPIVNGPMTQVIQAMVICPNSELLARAYSNGDLYGVNGIHQNLALAFEGSLILGSWREFPPDNFPNVFKNNRSYVYMNSLKINPPPYLPAVVEIRFSFEESTSSGSLYQ